MTRRIATDWSRWWSTTPAKRTCVYCGAARTAAVFLHRQAAMFDTMRKVFRKSSDLARDERQPAPPTQIRRALRELGMVWISAHSPQGTGRVERGFGTAQDRLVNGLRVAGARTLEETNRYLQSEFVSCARPPRMRQSEFLTLSSMHPGRLDTRLACSPGTAHGNFKTDFSCEQTAKLADILFGFGGLATFVILQNLL